MIDILSRRLLVRDDGSGKCREKLDGTLAEFESEDAIILLGDPGMGKTTIFRESAKEHYTTVRKFLIAPKVTFGSALFLDALDEYRTVASGHDVIAEVAKALCSLKKPKFRLSCRAADWFGTQDQEVLRVASASGRIVVLELCPLTRSEILSAVQGKVPDPVVFLHEVESKGLENLLGNPQTLELLACAWSGDKKPRNKFEAFEIGISKLIKEINVQHVPRGVNRFDHSDLLKAAGTAASIILLSNSVGISRSEPADGSGYVSHTVVPQELRQSLDIALKRRIFISTEVDRFEFPHRTIAEFLAAKDISNRIQNGLPINRVMALICIDGRPVSSLRGLFAWLMCMLGHLSTGYVKLDPYGVATYGDASVLAPDAQRQIWESLRDLHDPWFLTSEDNPGLFTELANLNTAEIIKKLIQDTTTSVHLKIAILEAIANSKDDIGITELIKDIVLDKDNNTWLRSTALKAFCKSVNYDRASLETLDFELANSLDDLDAPEVRVELLSINPKLGDWTKRLISTVEQVASAKKERLIFGRFYRLVTLPSDTDLDVVLDSASKVLMHKSPNRFELRSIFDGWLKRRLESPTLIMPSQLAKWLRNICLGRSRGSEKALALMKARFEQKPSLFEEVFYLLSNTNTNKERSFWLFVVHDLWQMLPETVWPVPHSEFFLTLAEKETDPQRAADLFRMYMNRFPSEGASVAFVESGINFLARRKDIAKIIGNWKSCKIEEHQKAEWRRSLKESRKQSINRAQNVASLTPLLMTIREGSEEHALAWAARVYQGFHTQVENVSNPLERLVNVTNEEIANALVEGLIRYVENPSIPKKEVVIESYFSNSIPWTHNLMCVSVYLLLNAGKRVPKEALPHCIAAVVTAYQIGDSVPGYNETLSKWIIQEVHENSFVVRSVLTEMWAYSARFKKGILPNFYELSKEPNSQRFLVSLSINVLNTGINEDNYTVCKLVSVLLLQDQEIVLEIGQKELERNELTSEVKAIWLTALFVVDPSKYINQWKIFMSGSDTNLWEAIKVIGYDRLENKRVPSLTSSQRAEVILLVGQRFPNVAQPNSSTGSQNPWDASQFVATQIKLLAMDSSLDTDNQLEILENDDKLTSYRDLIRHQRAQHQKQRRESKFIFASPDDVAKAIANCAPATPMDLLAFIEDHLNVLSDELARTQKERYRAYWNESGRDLIKPKREEVCSGLLADDLQKRVQTQGLIVTVEHHMISDKRCDLVVLQGSERLLPIEVKHHYNNELWTAWNNQLDYLYTRDAKAEGLGIYLVIWSGEVKGRMMPKIPNDFKRPASALEVKMFLETLIPEKDRYRLRVVVIDISGI